MNKHRMFPPMPVDVYDVLTSTQTLSLAENGAFHKLRLVYWLRGELPATDRELAAICNVSKGAWRRIRLRLAPLFGVDGAGRWLPSPSFLKRRQTIASRRAAAQARAAMSAARLAGALN